MLICPECGEEYRDTATVCAECNVELVHKKEKEKNKKEYKFKDWEVVYSANDLYEAEMIKAILISADIEAVILDQKDSSFFLSGDLGKIRVLVLKDKVQEALTIIESNSQFEDDEFDDEDDDELIK